MFLKFVTLPAAAFYATFLCFVELFYPTPLKSKLMVTLFRFFLMSCATNGKQDVFQSRAVALDQLLSAVLDLPFFLGWVFLVSTVWRAWPTTIDFSAAVHSHAEFEKEEPRDTEAGCCSGSPSSLPPSAWSVWWSLSSDAKDEVLLSWRVCVVKQLLLVLRDLPFLAVLVLLLGTAYRAPGVVLSLVQSRKRVRNDGDDKGGVAVRRMRVGVHCWSFSPVRL